MPGGYRINLWQRLVNGGYTVDLVGSQFNGPGSLGDHDHEGSWLVGLVTFVALGSISWAHVNATSTVTQSWSKSVECAVIPQRSATAQLGLHLLTEDRSSRIEV